MDFTPKQLQYLFYLDLYKNSGRLISDLAGQLNVSKAAVSQMLNVYETNGLIRHSPDGLILGDKAEPVIAELKEKYRRIFPFFQGLPGLTEETAGEGALRYICWMPEESVEGLVQALKAKEEFNRIRWDVADRTTDRPFPFADGRYPVLFDVYRAESNEISMGDKGFAKPAIITVKAGRGTITLTRREIRYQSRTGKRFRGKLTRLSCLYGDNFVPLRPKNNEYTIPLHYIRKLSRTPDGTLCGTLRIKAETGSCGVSMPVSEADILFRFSS
ncbi:NEAr transporter [Syntrophobotulus glycolicus DSM 8271]|uniref:NEAr transporter n=1 Tax=Syntrophobotulus glycolicus (strain DSM 8271 / FlGlyR) TaxID=645991 RepID=F0SWZ7_SYNGF|nr:MarR family transcriptional regulator [Syntrophobotulus glycolicus]ADY55780.1 NEAr transporter [Syntrophobotulus glycolicus DSM 8271]